MLIVAMMRCSTSLFHYSAASGDASGPRGLWRSAHAAASVPSGPAAGSGVAAVAVERLHCVVAAMAVANMAMTWPLVRWDRPALEHEVASPSFYFHDGRD
jgi:hypothetical protein